MKKEAEIRTEMNYYTEGNTVRRMEALPDYREEQRKRREREREAEQKRQRRIVRRHQEQAMRASRSYVVFLTIAVMFACVFAGTFIKLRSDVTARSKIISKLESQIADLKAENDEAEKRLNMSIDLDSIKNIAINEYGMFYASEGQIIYYTIDDDDYMNQYSEIPEK